MNCDALLAAAHSGVDPSAGSPSSAAARFEQLLQQCTPLEAGDQYLAPPTAAEAAGDNPLFRALSHLQRMELPQPTSHGPQPSQEGGPDVVQEFADVAEATVAMQMELLRTSIMMESMNSAKQGVSTLFQLQG